MARFYFHMKTGEHVEIDSDGTEFPTLAAARYEAVQSAREILADAIKGGRNATIDAFVISDENGLKVATISLIDVLPKNMVRFGKRL